MEEKTSYSQNSYLKQPKSLKAQKPWSIHEIGIATRRQHCAVRTRLHPGMGSCAGNSVKWNGSPGWDTHPAIDHVQSVYTLTHTGSEVGWWGEDINHYIWMFLGCFIFLSSGLSLIFFFFFKHSLMAKYVFPWNWNLGWWFYILKAFFVTHSWPAIGFCNTPQAHRGWVSCFLGFVPTF